MSHQSSVTFIEAALLNYVLFENRKIVSSDENDSSERIAANRNNCSKEKELKLPSIKQSKTYSIRL